MNLLTKLVSSLLGTGLVAGGTAAYIMNRTTEQYSETIETKMQSILNSEQLNGKRIPINEDDWKKAAQQQTPNGSSVIEIWAAKDFCESAVKQSEVSALIEKCTVQI